MPDLRSRGVRLAVVLAAPSATILALALVAGAGSAQAASAGRSPLAGTRPAWVAGAHFVRPAPAGEPITTQVYLADTAGLAAYAQKVSTPGSSLYGHFLTPAQVEAKFGPSASATSSVESWLRGSGLRVSQVSLGEIQATGTVSDAEHAYGTSLNEYKTSSGTYRAPAGNVQVPSGLAGDLVSVDGLSAKPAVMQPAGLDNEIGPVRPGISKDASAKPTQSTGADGSPFVGPTPCSQYWGQLTDTTDPAFNGAHQPYDICGYVPSQLRDAYNLSSHETGAGVTVAITDAYASPTIVSDADTYAINHGDQPFAPGQFTQTVETPNPADEAECGGEADWQPEQTLDVEAVHALAPGAKIHYYGAASCTDQDFMTVLAAIIDGHTANIITNSWGEVISSTTGNEPAANIAEFTQLFEQAGAEGIEVSFSAGDCGPENPVTVCGTDDTSSQPQADFPDSDPYVTSVGGTAVEIGKHGNVERTVPWGDDAWLLESGSWVSLSGLGYLPHGWIYGGGGGTSGPATGDTFPGFTQPWYQRGYVPESLATTLPTGQTSAVPMRTTPDVSMDADPYTGFLIGMTQTLPDGSTGYGESDIGGTSLASPLFAALLADSIQSHLASRGFVNPSLYQDLGRGVFSSVVTPSAASAPDTILPPFEGEPPLAVELGDDLDLIGTPGYSEAGGVGMPSGPILAR